MKTFIALIKIGIFGILSVAVGTILWNHGTQTIQHTQRTTEIDWPNVLKDLGLLAVLVFCLTGVTRSWQRRHQGASGDRKRERRHQRRTVDNIRIPK